MRSKAHVKTHPLHPMLVVFPIAFFTGALIAESIFACNSDERFYFSSRLLSWGGIVGALAAAVAGVIDLINTVPPNSSARSRGIKHGMLNTLVVVLFIITVLLDEDISPVARVIIKAIAVIVMWSAAWMGGTLVHRNHIGVFNRYASSGKWQEKVYQSPQFPLKVIKVDELLNDQMLLLRFRNKRIALCKTDNSFYAIDDRCTHKGGSLAGGAIIKGIVQCPWHGTQFDCRNGSVYAGPANVPVACYPVSVRDGYVFLEKIELA